MAFSLPTYLQKSSLDSVTISLLIQIFENDMRNGFESQFKQIENKATELSQKLVRNKGNANNIKEKGCMMKLQRMKEYLMLETFTDGSLLSTP